MDTAKVYIHFAKAFDAGDSDFSDAAAWKMYQAESLGGEHNFPYYEKTDGKFNGFALGKHFMDLQLAMWKEDIQDGLLFKYELENRYEEDIQSFIQKFLEGVHRDQTVPFYASSRSDTSGLY